MFTNFNQVIEFFNDRKHLGIKPGLGRVNQLLMLMDHPEEKVCAIHVAGTNGKGSTISYLKNALTANNYKVGTFISPSFEGITGYIFCNDKKITEKEFQKMLNLMYPAIKQLDRDNCSPTEFEIITVLAFMYFARNTDIVLIETGMGGRYDTTNCFTPILSIITTVDLDHTSFLGYTIAEIADHKAGIIKKKIPVIIGPMNNQALYVIQEEAKQKQAPVSFLTKDFNYSSPKSTDNGQSFIWYGHHDLNFSVSLKMYGKHQVQNCSLAIMALVCLKEQGYAIKWHKVLTGIERTIVQGRFEVVQKSPQIVLDGAHNPAGVRTCINTILANSKTVNRHLIFAAFKDKDTGQMLKQLTPYFSTVILTTFDHPRAADTDELFHLAPSENIQKIVHTEWKQVINEVIQKTDKDHAYYIMGSLHFIALVRSYYFNC